MSDTDDTPPRTAERDIMQQILLHLSRGRCRLWRNNVGVGWQGRMISHAGGRVTLADARPLHAGLCRGSADLVGWVSVEITPEMVGRRVAVICGVEVKSPTGRTTPEQRQWIQACQDAGGIAGVARSPEEAQAIIDDWISQ